MLRYRLPPLWADLHYSKNERIASHRRLVGRPEQYSTQIEHMPKEHQQYLEWNGDRFRRWAKEVGPNTYKVIDAILASNKIEQQTYRSCMGIIRLADKHTKAFVRFYYGSNKVR